EAVAELDGIDNINCTSKEQSAGMVLEIEDGLDLQEILQEVKNAVDAISDFPEDIELPTVAKVVRRRHVIAVTLSGDVPEEVLFEYAESIKEGFLKVEGLNFVELGGSRIKEIRVEITPETLNQYGLTLQDVASRIKQTSLDLPAGSLRSGKNQIYLRTKALKNRVEEFGRIEILTNKAGVTLYLGDMAKIEENLEEKSSFLFFDREPSVMFDVYQSPSFSPNTISIKANQFIDEQNKILPPQLRLKVWNDRSTYFQDRFDLMIRNAGFGLILVFGILTLFLEIRLAFWVMIGIPVSFLGSLIILPYTGVSINMISMFAFILVLGIVVDDAIVIGERIFQLREQGKDRMTAAIKGCQEMAPPVIFAIITTMVAFAPLSFIDGRMGKFLAAIPVIVISVIGLSLFEGLFVLPAHLAHGSSRPLPGPFRFLDYVRSGCDKFLRWVIRKPYDWLLSLAINNRYATTALGVVFLMLSLGLVGGGVVPMEFFPSIESDRVNLTIELPTGFPAQETEKVIRQVEQQGIDLLDRIDKKANNGRKSLEHMYSKVQTQSTRNPSAATTANIQFLLRDETIRNVSSFKFARMWRRSIKDTPDIQSVTIRSRGMHFADDINISLSHKNSEILSKLKRETKEHLGEYVGVTEVMDSEKDGNREFQFSLTKEAITLGITPQIFATNLRNTFQGIEALTIKKPRHDTPVIVMIPKEYRENLNTLETILLRAPSGGMISMADAATIIEQKEPVSIRRIDQERVINITASVEEESQTIDIVTDSIKENLVPKFEAEYPDLTIKMEGAQKERMKSLKSLWMGFVAALLLIYAILAIFFRSYVQPLIVMSAIPFGIAGAVGGHLILGHAVSFMSLFGLVGLTGVVVNDSLILIDAINRHPQHKTDLFLALQEAAKSRLRPIMLTSITTFVGLMPILAEPSRQAQFLIPMAISLGVGIMFATFITLILIPSFYMIYHDFKTY
ncbi:MAG: efflux RND transporter permease subunit, partial [Proteobacteria bacterium]|nr:efflux RND transporter permease subunit [Pseudomonadota bacterium]